MRRENKENLIEPASAEVREILESVDETPTYDELAAIPANEWKQLIRDRGNEFYAVEREEKEVENQLYKELEEFLRTVTEDCEASQDPAETFPDTQILSDLDFSQETNLIFMEFNPSEEPSISESIRRNS